jgi:hypothetical protein
LLVSRLGEQYTTLASNGQIYTMLYLFGYQGAVMANTDKFEVEEYAIIGRTFTEYVRMFDLDSAALNGSVLGCPSGVGSFVAEACEREIPATGADIIYELPHNRLKQRCRKDYEQVASQLPEKADLFNWDFYGDIERRQQFLKQAYEAFLDDYATERDRYIHAALPDLPFSTSSFSLVLSAHFLFLYGDRLDYAFHLDSLRELSRVAADEVRVFPLVGLDTEQYRHLDAIIEALREDGLTADRVNVPFEFQKGANEMLVISCG